MTKKKIVTAASITAVVLLLNACVTGKVQRVVDPSSDRNITITARSFNFYPEHIVINGPAQVTFNIENRANLLSHNFSVNDPDGKLILSVDIPKGKTVSVNISFTRPGKYEFFCNKPLHTQLGMKGLIEVTP